MPGTIPYEQIAGHFAADQEALPLMKRFTESLDAHVQGLEEGQQHTDALRLQQAAADYYTKLEQFKNDIQTVKKEELSDRLRELCRSGAAFDEEYTTYQRRNHPDLGEAGQQFDGFWTKSQFEKGLPFTDALQDNVGYMLRDPKTERSLYQMRRQSPVQVLPSRQNNYDDEFEFEDDEPEEEPEEGAGEEQKEEEGAGEEKEAGQEDVPGKQEDPGEKEEEPIRIDEVKAKEDGGKKEEEGPGLPKENDLLEIGQENAAEAGGQPVDVNPYRAYQQRQWDAAAAAQTPEERQAALINILYTQSLVQRAADRDQTPAALSDKDLKKKASAFRKNHEDVLAYLFSEDDDTVYADNRDAGDMLRDFQKYKADMIKEKYTIPVRDREAYDAKLASTRASLRATGHGSYYGIFVRFWNSGKYNKAIRAIDNVMEEGLNPRPRTVYKAVKAVKSYISSHATERSSTFGKVRFISMMHFLRNSMPPEDFRKYCDELNAARGNPDPTSSQYVAPEDFIQPSGNGGTFAQFRKDALERMSGHEGVTPADAAYLGAVCDACDGAYNTNIGYGYADSDLIFHNESRRIRMDARRLENDPDLLYIHSVFTKNHTPEEQQEMARAKGFATLFADPAATAEKLRAIEAKGENPVFYLSPSGSVKAGSEKSAERDRIKAEEKKQAEALKKGEGAAEDAKKGEEVGEGKKEQGGPDPLHI